MNNIISYENGGIIDNNDLVNDKTREVPVNLESLNNATSFLKNRSLLLVQKYTIGSNAVNKADTLPQKKQGFLDLAAHFPIFLLLNRIKELILITYPNRIL